MPTELETLTQIARIKYLSKELEISKLSQRQENIVLTFENGNVDFDISELVKQYKDKVKFSPGIKTMITIKIKENNQEKLLVDVISFLNELKKIKKCDII